MVGGYSVIAAEVLHPTIYSNASCCLFRPRGLLQLDKNSQPVSRKRGRLVLAALGMADRRSQICNLKFAICDPEEPAFDTRTARPSGLKNVGLRLILLRQDQRRPGQGLGNFAAGLDGREASIF